MSEPTPPRTFTYKVIHPTELDWVTLSVALDVDPDAPDHRPRVRCSKYPDPWLPYEYPWLASCSCGWAITLSNWRVVQDLALCHADRIAA